MSGCGRAESRAFAEPIGAAETINKYAGRLIVALIEELQRRGLGVRRADLTVKKVDGTKQAIRAGTVKPVHDIAWLTKLFRHRTEKIVPGFGIEKLTLVEVMAEPLQERQRSSSLVEDEVIDVTPLIDIFCNRGQKVYRLAPVASDVPERSVQRIKAAADPIEVSWTSHWRRPVRLLTHPEPIEAIALLPDRPPVSIVWRGKRRKVRRADGPEQIFGEWWQLDSEMDPETGSDRWFMHGIWPVWFWCGKSLDRRRG